MKHIAKSKLTIVVLLAVALLGVTRNARAEVTIKFGWATTDSATDSYNFAAHAFADALEAAKPGYFKVGFFPNRLLGDERDMLQGLQLGTVDTALITNSVIANIDPAFTINDLPFLYPTNESAYKVLDGKLGQELFSRLASRKIVGLSWCDAGFRNVINRVRSINSVDDLHGLKIRVIESPLFVRMFGLLNAGGVPMPFGSVFSALQQGTIDGMEGPTWAIASNRFDEVAKYLSLTRHIYSAIPILISGRLFDRLSAEDKKIVTEAAGTACAKERAFDDETDAKVIEGMIKRGVVVNKVSDIAPFRAQVMPLYGEYREKIGVELFDRWLSGVEQSK
jgi:TRAP-type transport system periplasmic protein